jgi:hypothetical protein
MDRSDGVAELAGMLYSCTIVSKVKRDNECHCRGELSEGQMDRRMHKCKDVQFVI